jgi:hypothetical protein
MITKSSISITKEILLFIGLVSSMFIGLVSSMFIGLVSSMFIGLVSSMFIGSIMPYVMYFAFGNWHIIIPIILFVASIISDYKIALILSKEVIIDSLVKK